MTSEEILCEFPASESVKEDLGVEESGAKLPDDLGWVIGDVNEFRLYEPLRRLEHRSIGEFVRPTDVASLELELRFEYLAFGAGEIKFGQCDYLTGAFSYAHVANPELARVTGFGVVSALDRVRSIRGQQRNYTKRVRYSSSARLAAPPHNGSPCYPPF